MNSLRSRGDSAHFLRQSRRAGRKTHETQRKYTDESGNLSVSPRINQNGSVCAIEGITSPDGRILGKMGHSERKGSNLYKNIYGEMEQNIFLSGVEYFK